MADLSWLANLPGQLIKDPKASGNFGQTFAGASAASATDSVLQEHLAQIRQYDPNASLMQTGENNNYYDISYDQGKLPAVPTTGAAGERAGRVPPGGFNAKSIAAYKMGGADVIWHSLTDPKKVQNTMYGELTPESNVTTKVTPGSISMFEKLAPMLPMLFAGAMNPGMFASFGGELTKLMAQLPQMLDKTKGP